MTHDRSAVPANTSSSLLDNLIAFTPLRERLTPREFAGDDRFVRFRDYDIHYSDDGPREAPAVLFIHGFAAWAFTWRAQRRTLVEAGYRAIAVDQLGYGASDRPMAPVYSTHAQASAHLAVLDALGIGQALLVGHSFGARVALQLAITAPERVRSIVAICPEAFATERPPIGKLTAIPILGDALAFVTLSPPLVPVGLRALSKNKAWVTEEAAAGYAAPLAVKGTAAAQVWQARSPKDGPQPVPQNLAAVRQPTLLLWGADDSVFPASDGQRLARILPEAQLRVLPDVGHLPHEEAAEEVSGEIVEFFRRVVLPDGEHETENSR